MYATPRTSIPFCDHSLPHHQCATGNTHPLPTLPHRACYPRRSHQTQPYDVNGNSLGSGIKAKPRAVSEMGSESLAYPIRLGARRNYSRPFLATPQRVRRAILEEPQQAGEIALGDEEPARSGADDVCNGTADANVETEDYLEDRESDCDISFSSFVGQDSASPRESDDLTIPLRNQSLSALSRPSALTETPSRPRRQHAKTQSLPFTPPVFRASASSSRQARTRSLLLSFSSPPFSGIQHSSPSFDEATTSTPPPPSPPAPAAHPLHSSPSLRQSLRELAPEITPPSAAAARPPRPPRPRRPTLTSPSITTLRLFPALPPPPLHHPGHGHGPGPASPTTSLSSSHSGSGSMSMTIPLSSPYPGPSMPTPGSLPHGSGLATSTGLAGPYGLEGHGFTAQTSFFEDDEDDEKRGLMEYLRVRRSGSVRRSGGANGAGMGAGWWRWWVC